MPSCKICGLFSQFDAISPVHLGVRVGCVRGLSLRTGGGDLITGGDSAGEVFSEYTPLGAFNLVNSLIFPSAMEQLESSSLLIGTHKKINNELQI